MQTRHRKDHRGLGLPDPDHPVNRRRLYPYCMDLYRQHPRRRYSLNLRHNQLLPRWHSLNRSLHTAVAVQDRMHPADRSHFDLPHRPAHHRHPYQDYWDQSPEKSRARCEDHHYHNPV